MKKLFLIPLLACFFCIGAYANSAKIGEQPFASVAAAIESIETTDWTTIILDGDEEEYILIPANRKIILNLNSHRVKSPNTPGQNDDVENYASIYNLGCLHIIAEGDAIVSAPMVSGYMGDEWKYPITNKGQLIIDGGTYVCRSNNMYGLVMNPPVIWNVGDDFSVVINGGLFVLEKNYKTLSGGAFQGIITAGEDDDVIINGGDFTFNGVDGLGENVSYAGARIPDRISAGHIGKWIDFTGTYGGVNVTRLYHVATPFSYAEGATPINSDVKKEDILLESGAVVTLAEGTTMTVEDVLAFEDATAQLIIMPGATLVVGDEIRAGDENNIVLTMDAKNNLYSNLFIQAGQLQDAHPKATVKLVSRAYKKDDTHYIWQRFTVPTYLTDFKLSDIQYASAPTAFYKWDYSADDWAYIEDDDEALEPFRCYIMTTSNTTDGAEYTFETELVGNGNPTMTLREGWNGFANSYTAPIDLQALLEDIFTEENAAVAGYVYVNNVKGGDKWTPISYGNVQAKNLRVRQVDPMQGFLYYGLTESEDPIQLNYAKYVWEPKFPTNNAPARRVAKEVEFTTATIVVEDGDNDEDYIDLFLGESFSEAYDNGFDVEKYPNEGYINFYVSADKDYAQFAHNNLDNVSLTLETQESNSFKMTFENVSLENYFILDNLTTTETEIKEGNEYAFTAEANSTIAGRFTIIKKSGEDPSADVTVKAQNSKGYYSLTGQYMGENFHALESGIYINNGKKVVR